MSETSISHQIDETVEIYPEPIINEYQALRINCRSKYLEQRKKLWLDFNEQIKPIQIEYSRKIAPYRAKLTRNYNKLRKQHQKELQEIEDRYLLENPNKEIPKHSIY